MAQDFFRIPTPGIEIESDDFTSRMNILQGTGAPGVRQVEKDAPVGSVYYQTDVASNDLHTWWKYRDVNNDVTDWRAAASKDYVDNQIGTSFTGTAPASVVTVLDDSILTSDATEVKWMLQIKDSGGARQSFEIHALTDEITASFTTFALLKVGGNIGGNIGFDVTVGNSPQSFIVSLNPNVGAGALTYTLRRIAFSFLA